jgi:phage gp29-like protein
MEKQLKPALEMIENAGSYEEIGERLYDLYPDMENERFRELMTRAMFAAGLAGYAGAGDES